MKKLIYIHQYFKTPDEGGAIRSYYIAKELVKRSFQVDIITSHSKSKYEFKLVDGIYVHYLPVSYMFDLSFTQRYIAFIKFTFAAIRYLNKLNKPDLLYVTSTPLTVGLAALWMKWTKRIPYIFEVRDLWPAAPIQLKILKNKFLIYVAELIEKVIYKNALKIIALSPGIESGILDKYPGARISIIPNMADLDLYYDGHEKNHLKKVFAIGYFGAIGLTNNINFILELAKECQNSHLPVIFKIAGEGMTKKDFQQKSINMQLHNVEIYPLMNRFELKKMMNAVDACLTSFLKIPILETNSPNKFFDGLAAGKLSIVNTKGWLKNLVEENKCGVYIDPDEVHKFPELIQPFIKDRILLKTWQKNAFSLAKNKFSKDKLTGEVCDLILTN
jgi:glycosyltransferase involved in cell wall biosynthesis